MSEGLPGDVSTAALVDRVLEQLAELHASDATVTAEAREAYESRRGCVHQDDELYEPWSAAFVEWFLVERVASDLGGAGGRPPGWRTLGAWQAEQASAIVAEPTLAPRIAILRALLSSHRSLFEIRMARAGRVVLADLLGGGLFDVAEPRSLNGVEVGDVAEFRLLGVSSAGGKPAGGSATGEDVYFGRTFVYHPKAARTAIMGHARAMRAAGKSRRDIVDRIAHLRVQVSKFRHMPPLRVYELGGKLAQTP